MMRFLSRSTAAPVLVLALLGLCLGAGTATAQVPYDMSYQGRLTDAVGAPLTGLVDMQMRIYDVISGGSALYVEDHTNVIVDDVGAFSVRLGAGTALLGTFDTALFAGVNRYLEVVVDGEALTPRLIIGSVPYAMHADNASSAQAAADGAQATADANAAEISTYATAITTNATAIADEAAARTAADAVHGADIAANAAGISANTSGITGNATAVSGNTTSIAANTTGISSNAIAIGQASATDVVHAADIAANVLDISSNTTNISANATSISANTSAIAGYPDAAPTTGYHAFASDGESHRVWDAETGIAWHDSPDNQLRSLDDHNIYLTEVINGGKSNGTDFACLSDGCNLQLPTLHQLEKLAQDCISVAVFSQNDGLWSYTGAQASHCASVWPDPSLGQPGNCTWSRTINAADPTQAYAICIVEGQSLTATIVVAALSAELPLRGCGGMSLMEAPSSIESTP